MSDNSTETAPAAAATDHQHHDEEVDVEDDNPKRQLIGADAAAASSCAPIFSLLANSDAPAWRLKRLRPAYVSMFILASFAACLAGCGPFVPDLVRQLQPPPPSPSPSPTPASVVGRLLYARGQCVAAAAAATANATTTFSCTAPPACHDLPALCRYRVGLLVCQAAAPACLLVCLCLLALAVCAARGAVARSRLLRGALGFALAGLAATVALLACLHALAAALTAAADLTTATYYSADSTGARLAYAACCLQALLACQLACLPACLRRVAADRARMLASLAGPQ